MSDSGSNKAARKSGADEAEATLRLIANLPAPHGLEDRVRAHLLVAPRRGRVIAWPGSLVRQSVRDAGWMRSVAAAAIVCVVAGGGWGIYARVQGGQLTRSIAGPAVPGSGSSSFSTGEARRRPQTLNGPSISGAMTDPASAKLAEGAANPKPAAKSPAIKMHAAQSKTVKKDAAAPGASQTQ